MIANALGLDLADLFCGAGGLTQGIVDAAKDLGQKIRSLTAVNHWLRAIQSHSANFPFARHLHQNLDAVDPKKAVPGGHLDLLAAAPECPHFSRARGAKPVNDQLRSSPWHIPRWLTDIRVESLIVENIPEFREWGPLIEKIGPDGKPVIDPMTGETVMVPDPARKGETFRAWVNAIAACGYTVEHRVVNAADHGDATIRRRFFLMARLGKKPIRWPEPTHTERTWHPARDIIDWSLKGRSIFGRRPELAEKTKARIAEGIRRNWGPFAEPFLVMLYGTGTVRSIDRPCPTVTAQGNHIYLCQPEPILIPFYGERKGQAPRFHRISEPLPTIPASGGGKFALVQGEIEDTVEAFFLKYYGTGVPHPVSDPLGTITTKGRFALVEPGQGKNGLDILLRMLRPHELAAAMSFRPGYLFSGTQTEQIIQIGNAVPCKTAKALAKAQLQMLLAA